MIYAFKRGNRSQTLKEHVNECLKALKKLENSKLWSDDFSCELVESVIVFHDVGKVAFQRKCEELSFTGHEFISTYVFWKVFEDELIGRDKLLYTFPIIFHHHAMYVKRRLKRLKEFRIRINENILDELAKILEEFVESKYISRTVDVLRNVNTNAVVDNVHNMINDIWYEFHGNFAKSALKLLLITIICDYEGSKKRGVQTGFGKVVGEFFMFSKLKISCDIFQE